MLESFRVDTFAPHIGQPFQVQIGNGEHLTFELIEVTDLAKEPDTVPVKPPRSPFSLVWRGPRAPILPQRTYRMEHGAIGAFDIFLVPIGPDEQGLRYEAVFA